MIIPEPADEALGQLVIRAVATANREKTSANEFREWPNHAPSILAIACGRRVDDGDADPSETSVSVV